MVFAVKSSESKMILANNGCFIFYTFALDDRNEWKSDDNKAFGCIILLIKIALEIRFCSLPLLKEKQKKPKN